MNNSYQNIQAVILAGGLSTRLRPITETIPKVMLEVNGKPFLEHKIEQLKEDGIKEIILLVGYLGEKIEEYFKDGKGFGVNILYSYEKEELLGTGGAIKNAEHLIKGVFFLLLNGDSYHKVDYKQLIETYTKEKAFGLIVLTNPTHVEEQEIVVAEKGEIKSILQRHTKDHEEFINKNQKILINGGVYLFNKKILNLIDKGKKVSIEQEIFPKILKEKIIGVEYNGYFKDIANEKNYNEIKEDLKDQKQKTILITGIGGMMGCHLADTLVDQGHKVIGIDFVPTTNIKELNQKAEYIECDIRDRNKLTNLLNKHRPELIFHLAAQSYPTVSWDRPEYTIEVNILGTVNLFEAVKELKLDPLIINACTSGEYGYVSPEEVPIKETHELKPLHPYGISKVAQELLAYQYNKNFGIKSISLRIFNTTGPKKVNDVCSDFTRQIIQMEKKLQEPIMKVGNLTTKRAITDVRDLNNGLIVAAEKGCIGETYNLSGEKVYLIADIVEMLRKLTKVKFSVQQDQKLMRTTDEPIIYGDSTKFKNATGWEQNYPLEKTLQDMLDYWRCVL